MKDERLTNLKAEIRNLNRSIVTLKELYPFKKDGFTFDGRLVGDIGEVVAEELF
jgi:hypothetical protein